MIVTPKGGRANWDLNVYLKNVQGEGDVFIKLEYKHQCFQPKIIARVF